MADYTVDLNVPHPINTVVEVANREGKPLVTESSVSVSTKDNAPIKTDSTLHVPEPIKTDSTLHVPEPIKTESRAELDLKPVAFDQCIRIRLDPLPATCVRSPYRQHIGFTLFGIEIFGLDLDGEARSYIDGKDPAPHVIPAGPRRHHDTPHRRDETRDSVRIRLGA